MLNNIMREEEAIEEYPEIPLINEKDYATNSFIRFLSTYIFSFDHKVIAKQYLFTGIFWGVLGGAMSLLIRLQLAFPHLDIHFLKPFLGKWIINGRLDPEFYLSMVTVHGTVMIFFVLTGGFIGTFSNLLIPLQIGARDMASGFINMLSYWFFFISSVVMFCSLFVEAGPASSGWTSYPPLSALPQATQGAGLGMTLWIFSIFLFIISTLLGSLNYIVTVINLRTSGMWMKRLPLTVGAQFFTAILSLLSFPVLMACLLLLLCDRMLHSNFFLSEIYIGGAALSYVGGSPVLFQHLFWFLGHPEVYIAIFPAFGIVSEVISTNARKPIFGYPAMVASIFLILLLSFVVWAHHMFVSGMNPFLGSIFSLTSLVIAVPSSVKVFNWITTLWRGNNHFTPAMLFAIAMVSFFISGGLTGIFLANPPIDIQMHDTYFVVAHFHLVMGSAAFFGLLTGIYHWFPKMFGRMMNPVLGYAHFWMTFIGVYLIFFPMHFIGLAGFPRRYYSFTIFETFQGFSDLNKMISIAAFITFAAQGIFLYNFFRSIFCGRTAPVNPWRSNTLEWTTASHKIHGNWKDKVPTVYRWPYDYSIEGEIQDFIPQDQPFRNSVQSKGTQI